MIEEALVALLLGDPTVSAIIGDRLDPNDLPETGDPSLAAAVYQVITDLPDSFTLSDGEPAQRARIQVTAWAPKAKAAKQLALAIRCVLQGYTGIVGDVAIANAWHAGGMMSRTEPELRRARVQADYILLYSAS